MNAELQAAARAGLLPGPRTRRRRFRTLTVNEQEMGGALESFVRKRHEQTELCGAAGVGPDLRGTRLLSSFSSFAPGNNYPGTWGMRGVVVDKIGAPPISGLLERGAGKAADTGHFGGRARRMASRAGGRKWRDTAGLERLRGHDVRSFGGR
jgi:hypothetical protein